jgi:DNA ligase (NAD+)
VKTHFEKLEKKDKKNSKKGPPIISITTEIEPEAARSIRGFFDSTAGREIRKRLNDLGIFPKGGKTQLFPEAQSQPFSGMNFVFTGSLKSMTRDMAAQAIRARGGIIVGKVSKNTNFLVTGEDPGTKLQEAERLGVAIIKEGEFIIKLGAEAKDLKGETPNEAQGKLL